MVICIINVSASSLIYTSPNTSVSGWAYLTTGHKGTISATYAFVYGIDEEEYQPIMAGGAALWGTNISVLKISNTNLAQGLIIINDLATNTLASTYIPPESVDSNGHIQAFNLTINTYYFDILTPALKYKVIAHELGHAYGLDHVPQNTNIMFGTANAYWFSSAQVTAQDIWGMKVVTHEHVHSASTTGTYTQLDVMSHEVTCSSCKGIYIQEHTFNAYNTCTKCGYEFY